MINDRKNGNLRAVLCNFLLSLATREHVYLNFSLNRLCNYKGGPNDGFLLNALKTLLGSRVLLHL